MTTAATVKTKASKETLAINGGAKTITLDIAKGTIPSYPPVFDKTAEKMKELYLSGKWSFNGKYEQEFSKNFAKYHTAEYGIYMVNGTVTLETALHALGVKAGDEVIVPSLTWMATAMAVVYNGAIPVFVDIEPDTLCLDPEKMKKAITPKTKAIIPVHIYGSMADMDRIMKIAKEHNLYVVEDCAHAHGGIWNGKGVGSIGHIGSFSFQQSKTLSSGEGGICLTNDPELRKKLFRIKHIGYDLGAAQGQAATGPEEGLVCHNYRGVEFTALILNDALKVLKAQTKKRDANANYLREYLKDVPGITIQARGRKADVQGYYNMVFLLDTGKLKDRITKKQVTDALTAEGLSTNSTYGPVYKHMLWNVSRNKYRIHSNEVTEDVCSNRALCLFHTALLADKKLIVKIGEAVKKVMLAYCR